MSLLELIAKILSDTPLLFTFAILAGIVLILIAGIPSLITILVKSEKLILTKNQSIMLAALGCIFIIIGIVYHFGVENEAPIIRDVDIDPKDEHVAVGSVIRINVSAEDRDLNLLQEIFSDPLLQYKLTLITPANESTTWGPIPNSSFMIHVSPEYNGMDQIIINVTDRKEGQKDIKGVGHEKPHKILIFSLPPEIKDVFPNDESPKPVNKKIWIKANATDPDADNNTRLYYKFYIMSPSSTKYLELPPSVENDFTENQRAWIPKTSDIGENTIRVDVIEGDENGIYAGAGRDTEYWPISITGTN